MDSVHFLDKLPFKRGWIHCVGIGGVGVSALAELLLDGGYKISGSDLEFNANCAALTARGARIGQGHKLENLPPGDCCGVITTSAAQLNNVESVELMRRGVLALRRGEFLSELCLCYQRPVLVAGSHGKSSISAMLGWILSKQYIDVGLLLGARYNNDQRHACLGNGDILVAEADESDGTVAMLKGYLSLISNMDGDHAWNDEQLAEQKCAFRRYAASAGHTIYIDSPALRSILEGLPNCQALTAGDLQKFDKFVPERFCGYERSNAALALSAAEYLQLDVAAAGAALQDYPGIERRQCEICRSADNRLVVLEDYAHHPVELASSLKVLKERYDQYKIWVVFQPHRHQRLQFYFKDFVQILSDPDLTVRVMPVFSAWEAASIEGVDHSDLVSHIRENGGKAEVINKDFTREADALVKSIAACQQPVLIALIGAGDISKLTPELEKIIRDQVN